jgi:hypothetical protein
MLESLGGDISRWGELPKEVGETGLWPDHQCTLGQPGALVRRFHRVDERPRLNLRHRDGGRVLRWSRGGLRRSRRLLHVLLRRLQALARGADHVVHGKSFAWRSKWRGD